MTPNEHKEHCGVHTEMERQRITVATFMGRIEEAIKTMKEDVHELFKQNSKIIEVNNEVKTELAGIKVKVFVIGAIGAGMIEFLIKRVFK